MNSRAVDEVLNLKRLRELRRVFLVLSLVVFITLLFDQVSIALNRTIPARGEIETNPFPLPAPAREPLVLYQEIITKRNLFNEASPSEAQPLPRISIEELTKDLRLKGIVVITEPEAILEDARTQGTVFLKEGSRLGEILIEEIREESVVLAYGEQESELRIGGSP